MTECTPEQNHTAICIVFEIQGQQFEAVGFLRDGECACLGEEAIQRCDNGHVVREEAGWQLLYQNRDQLPEELRKYWLITAWPGPDFPLGASRLGFGSRGWHDGWGDLCRQWDQFSLVVRRRVSSTA